ncbi:MAG: hypothetical protein RIE73_08845 [Coleofasciculus sp. C1-SOL-03]|jgi:hypothetical protein|uniref:hypothetical protein n=1 Tax=Coleofasciculus sp. C1-SOL-03 TaxID=3069522 RepID=UPI0032F814B1
MSSVRVIYAPPPTDSSIPASIFSIQIKDDEDVEWYWTQLPDGNRVVTNYQLVKIRQDVHSL